MQIQERRLLPKKESLTRRAFLDRGIKTLAGFTTASTIFQSCAPENNTTNKNKIQLTPTSSDITSAETPSHILQKKFQRIKQEFQGVTPDKLILAESFSENPKINPADWEINSLHIQTQKTPDGQKKISVYIVADRNNYAGQGKNKLPEDVHADFRAYFSNADDEPILQTVPGIQTDSFSLDQVSGYNGNPDNDRNKLVLGTVPFPISSDQITDLEKGMIIRIWAAGPATKRDTEFPYAMFTTSS